MHHASPNRPLKNRPYLSMTNKYRAKRTKSFSILPRLASMTAVMLLCVGTSILKGQTDAVSVSLPIAGMASQAMPVGSGNSSAGSRPQPEFEGNPKNMGSPYVPLDSWIYPALDRLASMGFVNTDLLECDRGRAAHAHKWSRRLKIRSTQRTE